MHLKTYQAVSDKVHRTTMGAACKVMHESAQAVRTEKEPKYSGAVVDVCVSFDGTWHKRGHTSHFGLGAVIELDSGLVLDLSVASNYCHGCSIKPKKSEDGHEE